MFLWGKKISLKTRIKPVIQLQRGGEVTRWWPERESNPYTGIFNPLNRGFKRFQEIPSNALNPLKAYI